MILESCVQIGTIYGYITGIHQRMKLIEKEFNLFRIEQMGNKLYFDVERRISIS